MEQKCQALDLKVVGSNPTSATNYNNKINDLYDTQKFGLGWCVLILITITGYLTFICLNLINIYFFNCFNTSSKEATT